MPPAANPFWQQIVGSVTEAVGGVVAQRIETARSAVADHFIPWTRQFAANAVAKMEGTLNLEQECECGGMKNGRAIPCEVQATFVCVSCRKFCCLGHCFVSWRGDAACWKCVSEHVKIKDASSASSGQPPGDGSPPGRAAQVKQQQLFSLRALGLQEGATWEQVGTAFRALGKHWHPDRHPENRAEAEANFKAVSAAYEFLKQTNYGQAS